MGTNLKKGERKGGRTKREEGAKLMEGGRALPAVRRIAVAKKDDKIIKDVSFDRIIKEREKKRDLRMTSPILIFGTGNRHKGIELGEILAPTGIEIKTLADFPEHPEIVEDGNTFAENAAKKARENALFFKRWTVAEDSGISVAALDGAPGIFSARFSGPDATSDRNNDLLLEKLDGVPLEKRGAWYTCSMALSDPDGELRFTCEEYCHGRILTERHGHNGFGYDPLFEVVEYHRTFGELDPAVKAAISHRARATRKLIAALGRLIAEGAIS